MIGSTPFFIEKLASFELSFKKLVKTYKSQSEKEKFANKISDIFRELICNPKHPKSLLEPIPKKYSVQSGWEFRKLRFSYGQGGSGLIRLMYLFNEENRVIKVFFIYSHEDIKTRPCDKTIRNLINEALKED